MYWSKNPMQQNKQKSIQAFSKAEIVKENCAICRYYLAFPHDEEPDEEPDDIDPADLEAPTGWCRRNPPAMMMSIEGAVWVRSEVPETWWCGECTPAVTYREIEAK